ncbi:MAG: hypothetical protein WCF47_17755 [Pseudolabrys sp.]
MLAILRRWPGGRAIEHKYQQRVYIELDAAVCTCSSDIILAFVAQ